MSTLLTLRSRARDEPPRPNSLPAEIGGGCTGRESVQIDVTAVDGFGNVYPLHAAV